jgi:hypothetical protein
MSTVDLRTGQPNSDLSRRLQAHVAYLASPQLKGRKPGTPENRKAAEYVASEFRKAGLEALPSLGGYAQTIASSIGENVMGMRRPSAHASPQWILLGANFDHLGGKYLGADDNAAAVAILIETARLSGALHHHSVLFVAFNSEEAPYIRTPLMGSQYFADHLPRELGALSRLQAVVVMDLVGGIHWDPLRETIFAAGAEMTAALYHRVNEASARLRSTPAAPGKDSLLVRPVGLHLVEEIPLAGRVPFSDYDAFRNAGVPFVFLSAGRTPRYHQPTDLPDTLHYERMASTVRWLQTLVTLIDEDTTPYRFEKHRIEFRDEVETFRPLVALAADEPTMIPGTSALSLWKMRQDRDWIQRLDVSNPGNEDIRRLERLSIRMQCLLADFSGCFLI